MKTVLQYLLAIALVIVLVDFFGFVSWVASGQQPLDGYYVGTLTAHTLRALLF